VKLEVRDLRQPERVHIREAKGNKERYVPLPTTMLLELREWWKTHRHRRGAVAGAAPVALGMPTLRALHACARRLAAPARAGSAAVRGISMMSVGPRFWPDERRCAVRAASGSCVALRGKPRRHSLRRRQHGGGAGPTTAPRHPAHRRRASSGWAFPPVAVPRLTQSA
jgi:integrase